MAVSYSARDGIAEGLSRTFDGEHPCPLCLAIAAAEREDTTEGNDEVPMPSALEKLVKDPLSFVESAIPASPFLREAAHALPAHAAGRPGRGPERPGVPPPRLIA